MKRTRKQKTAGVEVESKGGWIKSKKGGGGGGGLHKIGSVKNPLPTIPFVKHELKKFSNLIAQKPLVIKSHKRILREFRFI